MPEDLSQEVRVLAAAAKLDLALHEFPGDVAAAAASARAAAAALKLPPDPAAEPWPPMQTGFPA